MHDVESTWLLARSTGLLAYAVLTITVIAGLTLKSRLFGRAVKPAIIGAVHQTLSTAGLLAVAAHVVALLLDSEVDVPLVAVFVPGLAEYRPLATGLGVVALELWLVVHLSSRLRRRIGVQRWRSLHQLVFAVWALALVHGLATGSDSSLPWVQQMYAWSAAIVVALIGWRVLTAGSPASPRRPRVTPGPRPAARATPSTDTTTDTTTTPTGAHA